MSEGRPTTADDTEQPIKGMLENPKNMVEKRFVKMVMRQHAKLMRDQKRLKLGLTETRAPPEKKKLCQGGYIEH